MHTFGLQLDSIQALGKKYSTDHHLLTGLGFKETKKGRKEEGDWNKRQALHRWLHLKRRRLAPPLRTWSATCRQFSWTKTTRPLQTSSACSAAAVLPPPSRAHARPLARSSLVRRFLPTTLVAVAAAGLVLALTCSLRRRYGRTQRICRTTILTSTSTQGFRHQWSPKRTGVRRSGSRQCLEVLGIGGGGLQRSGVETRCSRCSQGRAKLVERRRC